ncbi:MAG: DNA polymerase/3'-5' exonuclease PolX [Planctomycetota bacterium]|nr:DNA polymerase/3'-5' exonuclease PolX [Planctomycetota bacterium]
MAGTNQQLAALFQEMADVLQILAGDSFRINAFLKAARVIDELGQDVAQIGPDVKALTALEGIGKGTAGRIVEFLTTGKIKEHDELLAQIPPGLRQLLAIPGLGPKTIALLWKEADVTSLDVLRAKLQTDELAKLKGMGPKKIENLRKNLQFIESAGARVRIGQAMPIARELVEKLRQVEGVRQAEFAGSLRRGKETIGDIDLLVAADVPPQGDPRQAEDPTARRISEAFLAIAPKGEVSGQGGTKTSVRTESGLQIDLRIVPPDSFGAALMYFTGSNEHNIALRERAIKMGMKLNEYALLKGDKPVAGRTEEEVYKALKLAWIPPEQREARGEVDVASAGPMPALITLEDIKAELHAHTTASDGLWSIMDLAQAAAARGFHTVAVTDHSKSQYQANGLSAERLEKHIVAIHAVAKQLKGTITVLAGSEVDILTDGSLDYPDSLLKELDIVVASPHAALSQEPAKATERLLKAMENPYVTIMGHPTGRLVSKREGLDPDIPKIAAAAAKRGVALEINANHYRLDLRDAHAKIALDAGAMLAIDTDAHGPADLNELTYGVLTARRAGARAEQVVNCLSREKLAAWLKSTRP